MNANSLRLVFTVLMAISFFGCKPKENSVSSSPAPNYFKTHFQDESQFIVATVLADIAEMAFYGKNKSIPDPKYFLVEVMEKPGSPDGAPVYSVQISLKEKQAPLKFELAINGMIWSPEVYSDAVKRIFGFVGLEPGKHPEKTDDGRVLDELTDGTALTIEELNQSISKELEQNFLNPTAHEKAAAILGAFILREASGSFYNVRSPLCRLTSHLAFARTLTGDAAPTVTGNVAEILLYTITYNQRDALERVEKLKESSPVVTSWLRALRAYNTQDYRVLAKLPNLSPVERRAWFCAFSAAATTTKAWDALIDQEKEVPDFCRVANEMGYSVGLGHELLESSLPLETNEIEKVYSLWHGKHLAAESWIKELNQMPEGCFTVGKNGTTAVRVVGWGQWAGFLQRQLGHAVHQGHNFLQNKWGVHEEAEAFAHEWNKKLSGLRLDPFVRRFTCSDEKVYHAAIDDGFAVTVATPHLVSAESWNYLCYKPRFAPLYSPNPNPHVNEWHKHNPPPGTAYDISPRMYHPSLVNQPDTVARLARLHEIAPYDPTIAEWLVKKKYGTNATYDQLTEIYRPVLDYNPNAMIVCAVAAKNQPDKYEPLMLKACALNPWRYTDLADYFYDRTNIDQAAIYAQKAIDLDPDRVRAANKTRWLMNYYLDKGQREKAKELADFGGEVYSYSGLITKAEFLEKTSQYEAALAWFKKIEERYQAWGEVVDFCIRYRLKTDDNRFNPELEKRVAKIFPKGLKRVTSKDFPSPPKNGVLIDEDKDSLRNAGLKKGDVIVAIDGIQVRDLMQYTYVRDTGHASDLNLIVWNGLEYISIQANPPKRRFGATFREYPGK